jgi:Polysaccharide lyase family 4, domain II
MIAVFVAVAVLLIPIGSALAYEPVSVTDAGTIQGKVTFTGSAPGPKKVIPTKDKEVCGGIREVPQMVLAPDKGVQNAFVYLKTVEKGKAWEKMAKTPTIDNEKCEFQPNVQVIPMGDIEIVNSDPVLHNTHGFYGKVTAFNVALPNQGQRIKKPLKKSGLVRVECDAHGWMRAWIYVAENPYYALTGKDGTFTIKDVPPGTYTLVAWQEFTGEVEQSVTIKAKESANVTIDLKKK